jgi:hypothetical protein
LVATHLRGLSLIARSIPQRQLHICCKRNPASFVAVVQVDRFGPRPLTVIWTPFDVESKQRQGSVLELALIAQPVFDGAHTC